MVPIIMSKYCDDEAVTDIGSCKLHGMDSSEPAQPDDTELREQIASTMMDGWMKSLKGGSYLVDGMKYPKTKLAINPDVLDSLLQLIADHDAQRDQQKKKELLGQWPHKEEPVLQQAKLTDYQQGKNEMRQETRQIVERFYS